MRECWCFHFRIKCDMLDYKNQEKNTAKIKALFAVHKHKHSCFFEPRQPCHPRQNFNPHQNFMDPHYPRHSRNLADSQKLVGNYYIVFTSVFPIIHCAIYIYIYINIIYIFIIYNLYIIIYNLYIYININIYIYNFSYIIFN